MRTTIVLLSLVAAVLLAPLGAAAGGICVSTKNWEEHRALEERTGVSLPPSWLWGAKVCVVQRGGEVLCWKHDAADAPPCVYLPPDDDASAPAN